MSELLYKIVIDNIHVYSKELRGLCSNPNFPVKLLDDYPNGLCGSKWPVSILSSNSAITPEFIETHIEGINGEKWDVSELSKNKSLTTKFIEDHLDWKWNMKYLSQNQCVTINFMKNHPKGINNSKWDDTTAVNNINLFLDEYLSFFKLLDHVTYPLLDYLCASEMITLEFIEHILKSYQKKDLNMRSLSSNSVITEEFVKKHPDLKWSLKGLCSNPSISTKFACKYIWKRNDPFFTCFGTLLFNVNADYEFLLKYNSNNKMIKHFTNPVNVHKMLFNKVYSRFRSLDKAFSDDDHGIREASNIAMEFPIAVVLLVAPIIIIENNIDINSLHQGYAWLLEENKWLTLEFVEKHIEGFNGIMWTDRVFSRCCSLEYIAENPEGYYCKNNDKIIPWDAEIISRRSYKTNVCVKSARKLSD